MKKKTVLRRKSDGYLRLGLAITGILTALILVGCFWTPYDPNALSSGAPLDVYKRQGCSVESSAEFVPAGLDLAGERHNVVILRLILPDAGPHGVDVLRLHQQRHPAGELALEMCIRDSCFPMCGYSCAV